MRSSTRRFLVLVVLGGMFYTSRRWWRVRTAPPGQTTPATGWPPVPTTPDPLTPDPLTPDPLTPDPLTPDPLTPDPLTPDPLTPDPLTPDPLTPDPVPTLGQAEQEEEIERRAAAGGDGLGGADPIEGHCPEGFPVKAKDRSRIYHLPGMAAYVRTVPDRCYRSAEEAEAHGFRRAKH